jgi:coatomer protein complex subunit gamma
LDKSVVVQEARVFNETPIRPAKCARTLTKVLYLLYQGEHFQTQEATNLFFSVTKLFQSKDVWMNYESHFNP